MTAGSCIACGYDLRGLAEGSACPECGRPIVESQQSATLRDGGTTWLFTLARWAAVLAVLEAVGACRGAILLYNSLCLRVLHAVGVRSAELARVWEIAMNLIAATGAWLFWSYVSRLSARIPSESLVRRSHSVRWGEVVGILAGPTLSWIIYRNTSLNYGFRLFGPISGRLLLLAYTVIAPFVLLSFATRVRGLVEGMPPKSS